MSRIKDGAGPSTSGHGIRPPPRTTTGRTYEYTKLSDVKVRTTVNLYAAVKFFKPPFPSRGTDYCMVAKLVDPSVGNLDEGLKCLFFAKEESTLPQIQSVGDIVRIHRLKVDNFKDAPQGNKGPGFSCLVFDGRQGAPTNPRSDSQNFTFGPKDEAKVLELRQWVSLTPELNVMSSDPPTFADVTEGEYYDLSCQIVSMARVDEKCVLFQVWDGTIPAEPFRKADLQDLSLDQKADLAQKVKGYLVDVFIFDNHVPTALRFKPGDFVRINNLHVAKYKPPDNEAGPSAQLVEFVVHKGTSYGRGLTTLSSDHPNLQDLKSVMKQVIDRSTTTEVSTSEQDDTAANGPVKKARTGESSAESDGLLGNSNVQEGNSNVQERDSMPQEGDSSVQGGDYTVQQGGSMAQGNNAAQERDSNVHETNSNKNEKDSIVSAEGSFASSSNSTDRRCLQETGTVITGHHHIKVTPIHAVLTHYTPFKFRLKAQLVDYCPRDVREFCCLFCYTCNYCIEIPSSLKRNDCQEEGREPSNSSFPCLRCKKTQSRDGNTDSAVIPTMKYIYIVKFTLDDGTGLLEAHMWKKHAVSTEAFFRDLPPCNLYRRQEDRQVLSDYMQQLCPGAASQTAAPWMECCIMSYTVKDSGPALYQIFDTTLALEAA
ncbi:POT1 [Branchiostoma lanceolatum]|uniref:Protection of telomeres protein 1 n=1 Tax=Branchiostoma lanceolatum TaxID=7740 RepID=A0A8J9VLX6_BRALA|nr:POT1 [Branchiostoma lanceolatum]